MAMSRKFLSKIIKIKGQIQVLLLQQNKDFMMTMINYHYASYDEKSCPIKEFLKQKLCRSYSIDPS